MKQKLGNILLIMLLITASLQIMTFQESNTLADPGAGGSEDGYLDFDYYFDTVSYLSNIIHNSSIYDPSEIKKGRYFGSDGDKAAAKYLKDNFINNSGFGSSDVRKVSLGDVQDASYDHDYTEFVNVTSYALTINHPDFMENTSLPSATIPQDDAYPIVAVRDPEWQGNYTMNTDFDDSRVYNERDFYNLFPKWRYGIQPYNITYDALNDYDIVLGNVTYVAADEEIPPHDYHTVFLLDEVEGVTDQIDNATNASGIILMNNISTLIFQNAENYNIPIMRIDTEDDPNHQNLTLIKQLLENNSIVVADNTIYDNNITFVYNLSSPECGPNHDYVILYNATNPDDWFLRGIMDIIISCDAHYIHNHFSLIYDCKGIIIYDDRVQNCHMMYNQFIDTPRFNSNLFPMFALPGFSVNETIGKFLWNHSGEPDNTIDGHVNQIHYKETDENPGVEAYNVEADLHITQSPNDAVVILSSRYDGMWGECSGDSAAGNGIIMGIAKYMQELNQSGIKPKYNVTFLMTTDEENGYYGAQFYNDTHRNDNIILWIGTEQLGFNTGALHNVYKNATHRIIVENITTLLDYNGKTGYSDIHSLTADITGYNNPSIYGNAGIGAEDVVFTERTDCDTILIHKNNDFVNHHHRGLALTQGDVLAPSNFDWNDAYMFYNITWETVKYFLYNPDCWFSDVSYTVFDSSNDGDSLNDSIRANFTIHSILPHDRVHLELDLGFEVGGMGGLWYGADNADYVVTNGVLNASLVFTIPDIDSEGNYSLCFRLFNSTGRINELVGIGEDNEDDSCGMDHYFPLYHPLGYAKVGNSSQSMHDRICGSIFTANEDSRADNITAYINQNFFETTHYKCMLYRANDSMLIGTTTENWTPRDGQALSPWWAVFNFTGTKPLLVKDTQYVITCWGNNVLSGIYYDESSSASTGRYDYETYGYPPDPAIFTNESRYYSIYCSYTPDVTLPQITDVIASPHTVGFGYNVTITANVTDNGSGVNLVKVRIGEPGGRQNNNTMTHISGDLYRYVFTDTWAVGQYNYSIWAQDNETNSNTSDTYHFHVSADATISIATLRDSYTGNQYINITDPPNPPENYTLVNRGLTWDKYYDAITGQNILEVSAGPINYQEENIWMPINNTLSQLAENHPAYVCGYRSGNNHGLYGVYFKSNAQNEWPIAFAYNKSDDPTIHAVRSKLVGVGYVDPQSDWAYQYLQNVQNSQGQTNDNSITYSGVFTGTDVTWRYGNTGMKEEITMSNATKTVLQNHPPSQYGLNDASSYLVFITKLDYQNLNLYNGSGLLDGNVTISDTGVDFKDALGQFKCALPLGEAYELNNDLVRQKLTYRIVHLKGNTYLLSGLKVSDLNEMTFPVVIDPTLTVYSTSSDGYIYKSGSVYSTVQSASSGTVNSSGTYITIGQKKDVGPTYYVYRGFVFFNTSALPSNAYLDNATLSLYKKDDYSTTDFDITIQNGQPTYPHNPMQTGDYFRNYYSGNGGTLGTSRFTSGYNAITMSNLNWINKTGITKLCLRSSRDISGTAPTGNEYVNAFSNEFGGIGCQPKLVINYRNQSKIKNTGSTNIKGYLLIQIQFYNTSQAKWVLDDDTVNESTPRIISASGSGSGSQLGLDTIFNGLLRASDLTHGTGTYRVYAAFRDSEGNILKTNSGAELKTWWQFSKT